MNTDNSFYTDVLKGLVARPKYLLSKYFYDEIGSAIFQEIMRMPEYYPTDCEFEIFESFQREICENITQFGKEFDIVEFGAGDGYKTSVLLRFLLSENYSFRYIPIDISSDALDGLKAKLQDEMPGLDVSPEHGDYFDAMAKLKADIERPKLILFLGSNLGNFNYSESVFFLKKLAEGMNPDDRLLIGLDLMKDPDIILKAYDDPHGITKRFNLNLLSRINKELGANFEIEKFRHKATYDPLSGAAKSYLVSTENQEVWVNAFERSFKFEAWEAIYMEMSQKYDNNHLQRLRNQSGFDFVEIFHDSRNYFSNSIWKLK